MPARHFTGCEDTIAIHIQVVEQCRGLGSLVLDLRGHCVRVALLSLDTLVSSPHRVEEGPSRVCGGAITLMQ